MLYTKFSLPWNILCTSASSFILPACYLAISKIYLKRDFFTQAGPSISLGLMQIPLGLAPRWVFVVLVAVETSIIFESTVSTAFSRSLFLHNLFAGKNAKASAWLIGFCTASLSFSLCYVFISSRLLFPIWVSSLVKIIQGLITSLLFVVVSSLKICSIFPSSS